MLFLVLQANYFEKISLILIFSLVNPNAPGLYYNDLLIFASVISKVFLKVSRLAADMDIHGYIHGYPRKICGYKYGWQVSYPRQAQVLGFSMHV